MSSLSNIPYTARSVNGIITLGDGILTIENGVINNATAIDTDHISTTTFSAGELAGINDLSFNTNPTISYGGDITITGRDDGDIIAGNATGIALVNFGIQDARGVSLINGGQLNFGTDANLNMNNGDMNDVANIFVNTIHAITPSDTLTFADISGVAFETYIDMGNNDIKNVNNISVATDISANGRVYADQFIYENFIRINDLVSVSTSAGTLNPSFPMAQIFNITGTGTLDINLPDLSLLPTGASKGSIVYFLRGSSSSIVNLNAYSGQSIRLIDGTLVSTFVFNSTTSNMVQFIFTRINITTYRWVQVNTIDIAELFKANTFTETQTIQDDLFVDGGTLQLNSGTTDLISRINYKDPTYDFNFLSQNASKLSISLGSATPDVNSKFYTISIGTDSNKDLTTGTANVGVGVGAIRYNTIGSNNVGVGYDALHEIITGDYNTAIGFRSGTNAFGTGYDTSYCTFLGTEARAGANIINSTAIGYGAVVDTSNTIVLGNTNINKVVCNGNLDMCGNDILNVYNINLTNINGSPYSGGGGGSQSLSQVLAIGNTASPYSIIANAGLQTTYITLAITGTTTLTSTSFGSITYLASSTATNTINLPAVVNGAVLNINNQSSHYHTIASSVNIMGAFGSQTTTQIINIGQGYVFVGISSKWECIQVYGVPYHYIRYSDVVQTIDNNIIPALYNLTGNNLDETTSGYYLDTWNGKRLDYNSADGTFTNNTGYTMTLQLEVRALSQPNTFTRNVGILKLATRWNESVPSWTNIPLNTTLLTNTIGFVILKNGEAFRVVYRGLVTSPDVCLFGSTNPAIGNRVYIYRIG